MAAQFVSKGYGQVEANRLTGITFGNIEAQAPAVSGSSHQDAIAELENGQFLCVVRDVSGKGPMGRVAVKPGEANPYDKPYLVYSEKKIYDERLGYSDFVDKASDKVDGLIYPRLIGITPDSCVFTTNTINAAPGSISEGDTLYIGDDGYLTTTQSINEVYKFIVTKLYTMPDGQPGVKLMAKIF